MEKSKIILHVCCGPCATSSIERLMIDGWTVELYYSNSNINTLREWERRLEGVIKTAKFFGLDCYYDGYMHSYWLSHVKGYENEPEKGKRCRLCFDFNFQSCSQKAEKKGYAGFTTSLTVSPYKNSATIFSVGNKFNNFIEYDFKKKEGYKRSLELSRGIGLYRQNYCGCEFSIR